MVHGSLTFQIVRLTAKDPAAARETTYIVTQVGSTSWLPYRRPLQAWLALVFARGLVG